MGSRDTTLVIMAAGYDNKSEGGANQLEPLGPNGEFMMDYSIYDAVEVGFNKVIFVIRKEMETEFRRAVGDRFSQKVTVEYAFQDVSDLPAGFTNRWGRKMPWGTGQAVLAVHDLVHEPFAVINADGYYGKEAFAKIHRYLESEMDTDAKVYDICMVGFILSNTLSENGGVTRGVCVVNDDHKLSKVTETYGIQIVNGKVRAKDGLGNETSALPRQRVSMNMWGLPPSFLDELEKDFPRFLSSLPNDDESTEYLLPQIIDRLVKLNLAEVTVLESNEKWFGVTYPEDKGAVVSEIKRLTDNGLYDGLS